MFSQLRFYLRYVVQKGETLPTFSSQTWKGHKTILKEEGNFLVTQVEEEAEFKKGTFRESNGDEIIEAEFKKGTFRESNGDVKIIHVNVPANIFANEFAQ